MLECVSLHECCHEGFSLWCEFSRSGDDRILQFGPPGGGQFANSVCYCWAVCLVLGSAGTIQTVLNTCEFWLLKLVVERQ